MPISLVGVTLHAKDGDVIQPKPDSERLVSYDAPIKSLQYPDHAFDMKLRHDINPDMPLYREPTSLRARGKVVTRGPNALLQLPLVLDVSVGVGGLDQFTPIPEATPMDPFFLIDGMTEDSTGVPGGMEKNCLLVEVDRDDIQGYYIALRMAGKLTLAVSEYPPGTQIQATARYSCLGCPTRGELAQVVVFDADTVQPRSGRYLTSRSWKESESCSGTSESQNAYRMTDGLWDDMTEFGPEEPTQLSPSDVASTAFSPLSPAPAQSFIRPPSFDDPRSGKADVYQPPPMPQSLSQLSQFQPFIDDHLQEHPGQTGVSWKALEQEVSSGQLQAPTVPPPSDRMVPQSHFMDPRARPPPVTVQDTWPGTLQPQAAAGVDPGSLYQQSTTLVDTNGQLTSAGVAFASSLLGELAGGRLFASEEPLLPQVADIEPTQRPPPNRQGGQSNAPTTRYSGDGLVEPSGDDRNLRAPQGQGVFNTQTATTLASTRPPVQGAAPSLQNRNESPNPPNQSRSQGVSSNRRTQRAKPTSVAPPSASTGKFIHEDPSQYKAKPSKRPTSQRAPPIAPSGQNHPPYRGPSAPSSTMSAQQDPPRHAQAQSHTQPSATVSPAGARAAFAPQGQPPWSAFSGPTNYSPPRLHAANGMVGTGPAQQAIATRQLNVSQSGVSSSQWEVGPSNPKRPHEMAFAGGGGHEQAVPPQQRNRTR